MELKATKLHEYNPLADISTTNLIQRITEECIINLQKQRDKIIADKVKEIIGIDLNLEEEEKRKFKRFVFEYNDKQETVYFNDGSISGKRIVTFVKDQYQYNFDSPSLKLNVEYFYY